MASIIQVIRSPRLYGAKAISIISHQTGKLLGRIQALRFTIANWLMYPVTIDLGAGHVIRYRGLSFRSVARARKILTKEPGTTNWVRSFEDGANFWDIGANIGTYTLLAATYKKAQILAFEPLPTSFHDLASNCAENKLTDQISALCLAFSKSTKIDCLQIENMEAGYSGNTLIKSGSSAQINKIGVLSITIDDFIEMFKVEVPNYIKIDVDGGELDILSGGTKCLADAKVRSVLVEVEEHFPEKAEKIVNLMKSCGFNDYRIDPLIDLAEEKMSNYIFYRHARD